MYELTNYSILQDYKFKMVVVDWVWGTALCATVSGAAAWFSMRYGDRGPPLADYQHL